MQSSPDLVLTGLDTERSHSLDGGMVRIFFRLSGPPPLGWSYVFTTTWQTVAYPLKRPTGVGGDSIWIDCIPEEVGMHHLERLKRAVEEANQKYREGVLLQTIQANHQLDAEAELRARLQAMSQTLYPPPPPAPRVLGSAFLGRLWQSFSPPEKRNAPVRIAAR